jgi:erythrocyte band 7 integral membrane protein
MDDEYVPASYSTAEKCYMCSACCQLIVCPCSLCGAWQTIQEYERGVKLRFGKRTHKGVLSGGMHLALPNGVDNIMKIDIRERMIDVPAQSIITREGMSLQVDGVVYYRVAQAAKAMLEVHNVQRSVSVLSQTKIREVLGTKSFDELQSHREAIAAQLSHDMDVATDPWGIKVTRVEITDVKVPQSLLQAMATEAESERQSRALKIDSEARAKARIVQADAEAKAEIVRAESGAKASVVMAQGEAKAAQLTAEAASVMAKSPGTMQLRFMQTLQQISENPGKTTYIPFPTDMLSALAALSSATKKT